jgi:hypothetical protein
VGSKVNASARSIGWTTILTGCLWLLACVSSARTETYVSRGSAADLQPTQPSEFSNAQPTVNSSQIEAPDSIRYQYTKHKRHKNPNIAFALAVFPGVCYHGVGHWYAGEEKTAMIVFMTGCVGMLVMMCGAMGDIAPERYNQMSEEEKKEDNRWRDRTVLIGGIIFLGSWVFDMVAEMFLS